MLSLMGKFSKTLLTAALGAGIVLWNPDFKNENTKAELSKALLDKTEQAQKNKEQLSQVPTFSVNLKEDLENTPFGWKKPMIGPALGNLLGYSQASTIIKDFNPQIKGQNAQSSYRSLPEWSITLPLVYPELKSYFPEKLDQLWENQLFSPYKNQITTQDVIVISRCENWKAALAYYRNGKLTLASYVSLWVKGHKTVEGLFSLTHDAKYRRSKKYENAPMPYAIHFTGGYFMHQGVSNGENKSHGCVRVPGLYQKWLYEKLPKNKSQILLKGLYKPTLSKK